MSKPPRVIPWSISSLSSFETCPWRHYQTKIAKNVVEGQSEQMRHGNDVHKALEQAVNGRTLPDKHKVYQPIMMKVMATEGAKLAERNVAVNASFQSTDYWAPDAWARGKLDLTILREKSAVTMDWKTGKPKADSDQLMLAAGLTFAVHPAVEKVRTGYVWLAYDKIDTDVYTRADIPFIWQEFVPRVKRMEDALANDKWPKKPSGLCNNWCPVPKSLCQYSGKEG